jgi:hypothetical protein
MSSKTSQADDVDTGQGGVGPAIHDRGLGHNGELVDAM